MLTQLTVWNVRNVAEATLSDLSPVNIIAGANGAGKTSILEAIHLLSTARSFRHTQAKPVIRHQQDSLLVNGRWLNSVGLPHQSGIQRWRNGSVRIRCDGEKIATAAELATLLPVQVLNSEGFALVEGPPALRRQFLDWGVFHVEHAFFDLWAAAQRALRQRNALLKHGRIDRSSWRLWTDSYAVPGEQLSALRRRYFGALEDAFKAALASVAPELVSIVELALYRGWAEGKTLAAALAADAAVDQQRGFTRAGPHRADVRITASGVPAQEVLSRGQIKMVAAALKLAQGVLFREATGRQCLYLIDDLAAELDRAHRQDLCTELLRMDAQIFSTAIAAQEELECWSAAGAQKPASVFHVEHGALISAAGFS